MKKFLSIVGVSAVAALAAYAAYLAYDKFVKNAEDDDLIDSLDDEFEFEDEIQPTVSFSDRIKAAADRQLARIK